MGAIIQRLLKHKIFVIVIFFISSLLCALLAGTVSVNYNMMDYLPDEARSTIGLDIMKAEYQQDIPNVRVMVPNLTIPQALEYKQRLSSVDGVSEVSWLDDAVSLDVPLETLDQNTVESWYKDSNALYSVTVDTDKQVAALNAIKEIIGEDGAMSGSCVNTTVAMVTTNAELSKIIFMVVPIVFIILLLTTSSWFEPVLFLCTIGKAAVGQQKHHLVRLPENPFYLYPLFSHLCIGVAKDFGRAI